MRHPRATGKRRGFTLMEVMVAIMLMAIAMTTP